MQAPLSLLVAVAFLGCVRAPPEIQESLPIQRVLPNLGLTSIGCPVLGVLRLEGSPRLELPAPEPGYPVRLKVMTLEGTRKWEEAIEARMQGVLATTDKAGHLISLMTRSMPCGLFRDALAQQETPMERVNRDALAYGQAMAAENLDVLGVPSIEDLELVTYLGPGYQNPLTPNEPPAPTFTVSFKPVWARILLVPFAKRAMSDEQLWPKLPAEVKVEDLECMSSTQTEDAPAGGGGCYDRLNGKAHVPLRSAALLKRVADIYEFPDRIELHLDAWVSLVYPVKMPPGTLVAPREGRYVIGSTGIDVITGEDAAQLEGQAKRNPIDP